MMIKHCPTYFLTQMTCKSVVEISFMQPKILLSPNAILSSRLKETAGSQNFPKMNFNILLSWELGQGVIADFQKTNLA